MDWIGTAYPSQRFHTDLAYSRSRKSSDRNITLKRRRNFLANQLHFEDHAACLASSLGSPRARTKNRKERGKPGKIYYVRNVIGGENLIASGRTNTRPRFMDRIYSFRCESFMADRTGLGSTTLYYLAVRLAVVIVLRAYIRKSRWHNDGCIPRRMAFKRQCGALLKSSLPLLFEEKNCQNGSY